MDRKAQEWCSGWNFCRQHAVLVSIDSLPECCSTKNWRVHPITLCLGFFRFILVPSIYIQNTKNIRAPSPHHSGSVPSTISFRLDGACRMTMLTRLTIGIENITTNSKP